MSVFRTSALIELWRNPITDIFKIASSKTCSTFSIWKQVLTDVRNTNQVLELEYTIKIIQYSLLSFEMGKWK